MWREMGDSDKKEWEEKVKEAKEQYEKDYKEWLENGGEEAMKEVLTNSFATHTFYLSIEKGTIHERYQGFLNTFMSDDVFF